MARKAETCVKVSSGRVDSNFFKSYSPGGICGWSQRGGGTTILIGMYREFFKENILLKNHLPIKAVTLVKATSDNVDSNPFKSKS